MAKTSRAGQFKVEQRVGEPVDITLLRGFAKALPYMNRDAARALSAWMLAKSKDCRTVFGDPNDVGGRVFGAALKKYLKRRALGIL